MLLKNNCLWCKKNFQRNLSPSNIERGKGKYCSQKCSLKGWKKKFKEGKIMPYWAGLRKGWGLMKDKHYPKNHPIRKAVADSLRGKKGPLARNWKGGIYETYNDIRRSPLHKEWSRKILKRDNYECQLCGTKKNPFHANHIKKFIDYPNLRLDINNGITLCEYCHIKIVTNHEKEWGSYFNFNLEVRELQNVTYFSA